MTIKKRNEKSKPIGPTLLIILDGFGLANIKNPGNAITPQTAPNIFSYLKKFPNSQLKTFGRYVGLFEGQQGNSEAGHINIGAGRIVKQDLVQISDAIHDGTFFKNETFRQALFHVKKYNTAVHVLGLLTDRNSAHSYPDHFYALLEFLRREEQKKVYLHLFTDGRDSSPHGAGGFLRELRGHMLAEEKIATIMGRFYAMDRNKNWSRTKQAYEAMVAGKGCTAISAEEALSQSYNRGETDEYICPTVIVKNNKPIAKIKKNDAIFFINARSDRARQITKALAQKDFVKKNPDAFKRLEFPDRSRFVAMTDFGPDLEQVMTAFPSPDLQATLPMALSDLRQLYIAESEKYAHVTYFINGGYADAINGETRIKVESPHVSSYDKTPNMSADKVADIICQKVNKDMLDFCCVNFANPDMLGHTGNIEAAKKGINFMDKQVARLVDLALKKKGQVLIVADHGNAEEMLSATTNEMMTEHTLEPVPCILISAKYKHKKLKDGILADVAPTILKIMGQAQPAEMTGKSLI
ncbi:MAG: 2,3-bisphosphoglycerate-independent phosphoglycerate mutase [Candidatus Magasanikbacteria bacterium CG10_big_fil_rev_8_21_14_0_10_40_10]|uniref:2,3-bisphosphoglycerate-independent phosphoglycerate mutase n=1 Tax=Candidatus Magasanikbacteria bacterium CG10_big_fil_rev_8_21_14_0_10_40_10 TaxID=1974648 RepID=A0A2M6W536_9BACT|nr:MAG: 2,3-bisphosphoglycerate-independent phosphoglycerate mutase [Candidatus Magasanikbacteria bacterium CG10_big_fil_rev_8_21_14_0_10_40_10]